HQRGDGLHRRPHDHVLAVRDSALEAAGAVRGPQVAPALAADDGVVDLAARQPEGPPAVADLAGLNGRHAHHRLRQATVELAVPLRVRAQAHRHVPEPRLDDAAEGVALLLGLVDARHDPLLGLAVERPQRALVELRDARPVHAAVARDAAEADHAGAALDAGHLEQPEGDGAGRDAAGRLAGRRALQDVAEVLVAVLDAAGQVGVAGPGLRQRPLARLVARQRVHDLAPVRVVAVRDRDRDGRAGGA